MQPKEHIESIKKKLTNDSKVLKENNYDNLLRLLADKLYEKATHFIFEIIQNAEDNEYKNEYPSLVFKLTKSSPTNTHGSKGAIIIENNEIGFSQDNINAICSAAQTTKKKDKGYIGENGIGFKSVFQITSSPHIFSNGYSFKLPENDTESGLGYIVPSWVSNIPKQVDISKTTIILPLDKDGYGFEKIKKDLGDIEPETILFLSKIKKLQIEIGDDYSVFIMKDDAESPKLRLRYRKKGVNSHDNLNEYLVVSKIFNKPENISAKNRPKIEGREVTIAFPLSDGCDAAGKIFAYLPVSSNSGLPFLINADFLLTSSREDILVDELWNLWLRNCIHKVFIEAFTKGLDITECREKIYSFIPLESYSSFFEPIVGSIHNTLKNQKVVLTEPDNDKTLPEKTRITSKKFRSLLTDGYPEALLGDTKLVIASAEKYKKQLDAIGVKYLSYEEIKECLKDKKWISSHDYEWLIKCYKFLTSKTVKLDDCPIVPVKKDVLDKNVVFSCDKEQPIYFECDEETKKILANVPKNLRVPLAFLDEKFLEIIGKDDQLRKWMRKELNIYPFTRGNYAIDVLNWFEEHYREMNDEEIINTSYFLAKFMENDSDFSDIPILLADGRKMLLSEARDMAGIQAVVTPENLDVETGWQNIWTGNEDRKHLVILSEQYVTLKNDKKILNKLYKKLGITAYPLPYKEEKKLTPRTVTETTTNFLAPSVMQSIINTKESESICEWLKKNVPHNAIISPYSKKVKDNWSKKSISYDKYYSGKYETKYYDSEFLKMLKKNNWLPTTKGLVRPNHAFLSKSEIKEILSDSVPYFEGHLPDKIIELLGINKKATAGKLLDVLSEYSQSGQGDISFAKRAYKYFASLDHLDTEIIERLRNEKIIYIDNKDKSKWVALKDVIWSDQSDIFGNAFLYLEKYYPKLKDFFVDTIGIKKDADDEAFARQWLKIQQDKNLESEKVEKALTTIYQTLLPVFENNFERPEWWNDFIKNTKIWTQNRTFESPKHVFVPDDIELKKVFGKTDIYFAWKPEKDSFTKWEALYRALKLKYLSEHVRISTSEESKKDIRKTPLYLTESAKVLIVIWLFNKNKSAYQRIVKSGLLDSLLETKEAETNDLKVLYKLELKEIKKERNSCWNHEDKIMLLNESINDAHLKNSIAQNIARVLLPNKTYKDFATWIELVIGEKDCKSRCDQQDFTVPPEINNWMNKSSSEKSMETLSISDQNEDELIKQQEEGEQEDSSEDSKIINKKQRKETSSLSENGADECAVRLSEQTDDLESNEEISKTDFSEEDNLENFEANGGRNSEKQQQTEKKGHQYDYSKELRKAFNKPGQTKTRYKVSDDGMVRDPIRRREKSYDNHVERLENEPDEKERRWKTERTIIEGPDEQVREYLSQLYNGKCQICGKTFPQRSGRPFFVAKYLIPRRNARALDSTGNVLCLCADHFAKWVHGVIECDVDIIEQIKYFKTIAEGGIKTPVLKIKLCGEECEIVFKEKHFLDLQEILLASENYK